MATKKHSSSGGNPLLRQARLQAALRYDPEREALFQLLVAAQRKRATAEGNAMGRTRAVNALINTTAPRVAQGYQSAGLGATAEQMALSPDLMKLGPAADAFKGAIALEHQGTIDALARRAAESANDFELQRSGAQQTEELARSSAASEYGDAESDVLRRLESLAGEQGKFTAATLGTLTSQESDRAIRRESARLAHLDRLNSQAIAQGNLTERQRHDAVLEGQGQQRVDNAGRPGSAKPLTVNERAKRTDAIAGIESNAALYKRLLKSKHTGSSPRKGKPWTRTEIANYFRSKNVAPSVLLATADLANFGSILPHHRSVVEGHILGPLPRHWRPRARPKYKPASGR